MCFDKNKIIRVEQTGSTNTYLAGLIKSRDIPDGTVVITDKQTAGRGQRGNSWESEPGKNLAFSFVLYPCNLPVKKQFYISQCAALAVKRVLSEYVPEIKIKWPNDIYWKNRKICGILIENELKGSDICSAIIGIGININQDSFSAELKTSPASLKTITGKEFDREVILMQILECFSKFYEHLINRDFSSISTQYKKGLFSTGIFKDKNGIFEASIKDIEPDGMLVLSDSGNEERRYYFKEVEFVIDN